MSRQRDFAAVILAAGQGTRMKSDRHKVLHPIAGRAMLDHLFGVLDTLGPKRKIVIVGSGREQVESLAESRGAEVVVQGSQLGTAHAVLQSKTQLEDFAGDVLILFGDTPLVAAETMSRMLDRLHAPDSPAIVVVGSRPENPGHYGRIIA
ncbi:MAG: NTP transferase domain-containing protein, partial [Allosphingosinicella sp.]